jgi:TatD DNase family protein
MVDMGINLKGSEDLTALLKDAKDAGIHTVVLTGTSARNMRVNRREAVKHKRCFFTSGVHPHSAKELTRKTLEDIERDYKNDAKCIAVGECGLDYNRMHSPRNVQLKALDQQLELAAKLDAPLFLHERDKDIQPLGSCKDLIAALDKHKIDPSRVCVHCFTSDRLDVLQAYLAKGYVIGVTGFVCKTRRGQILREFIKQGHLPLDRIVVETDSPFMQPPGHQGPNVPANTSKVIATVAGLTNQSWETVKAVTTATAYRVFPRLCNDEPNPALNAIVLDSAVWPSL